MTRPDTNYIHENMGLDEVVLTLLQVANEAKLREQKDQREPSGNLKRKIIQKRLELEVKDVLFHKPAVIVFWKDGTKTSVVCGEHDTYDEEVGIALCFMKKLFGNNGSYNNIVKECLKMGRK